MTGGSDSTNGSKTKEPSCSNAQGGCLLTQAVIDPTREVPFVGHEHRWAQPMRVPADPAWYSQAITSSPATDQTSASVLPLLGFRIAGPDAGESGIAVSRAVIGQASEQCEHGALDQATDDWHQKEQNLSQCSLSRHFLLSERSGGC
jgi:hypothetical protein